jgi:UDP-N-acetylglucosamine--N-acetylmuramyl-(pentapeptide) pyrophosphoryl-undecaprenol N-acetylglucosamine transferase
VGVGGYLSGPAMLEAALRDIPTLLIEPNAVPGFTNRVLAPVVRMAAVGFEETANLYGAKARLTGHAVRKAFSSLPAREHVPPFTVLILGGSQGSAAINRCVIEALPLVSNQAQPMTFIHQTGERDYNAVSKAYQERGLAAEVQAFIENVPGAFARADLIVSRAGATAVAELAAAGKAALVVPFPAATDQHQLENARALECAGAARVVRQVELTPQRLASEIEDLLGHPGRLVEMERKARGLARPDAAARIADMIEELAR